MDLEEQGNLIVRLKEHGLQVTHQRLAIYQELNQSKEHPNAEMIYRSVRERFPMISLGTVYKTLERFAAVGLIQKVGPLSEVARYEVNILPHHHLVCLECQTIKDIHEPTLEGDMKVPGNSGYQIFQYQVFWQGLCPTCQQQGK
jgi:Fur family transcriptional regulator, peroxide stress response regulator